MNQMSKKFLTFKTDSRRQPTGELPDLVIADELKPSKNLAVVLKPEEIMTQRQAFDTFVGQKVENGEIVFFWREPVELPEIEANDGRPQFGTKVEPAVKVEKTTVFVAGFGRVQVPLFGLGGE